MAEPASLEENMAAYDAVKAEMEERHMRKYVVFYNRQFEGAFGTFNDAMVNIVPRFGRGPYLVREVGRPKILPMPVSWQLQRARASDG